MSSFISVIIPTFNPNPGRLNQVLEALKNQTLSIENWELIIIDNKSTPAVDIDLKWQPKCRIIREDQPGLTYARVRGFLESKCELVVLVDDDNILNNDYLTETQRIFNAYPKMGAAGGKSLGLFETDPPVWLKDFYMNLAIRDLGDDIILNEWNNNYPTAAPIGAGIAIRKSSLTNYINKIQTLQNPITDRQGKSLSSGGDNDMVLEIVKAGWQVGYFPSLIMKHIIPKERMTLNYLERLVNNTNKSWVLLLESHRINPWKKIAAWSVPFRKAKAWFACKAWRDDASRVKWQGACGTFDGLAQKNY